MKYFVYGHDGGKYGPVDTATLKLWANEGRIDSNTQIEDASSGRRMLAGTIPVVASTPTHTPGRSPHQSQPYSQVHNPSSGAGIPPPYQKPSAHSQNPYQSPYQRAQQQIPHSQSPYTQNPFQHPPVSPHNSWLGSDDEEANAVLLQAWVWIGIGAVIIGLGLGPFFVEFLAIITAAIGWKRAVDAKKMGHPNARIAILIALIVGGVAIALTIAWALFIGFFLFWWR